MTIISPIRALTKESANKLMVQLVNECIAPLEEPYDSKYDRAKVTRIRQAIKVLELYVTHTEYQEVLSRTREIERLITSIDTVTHDIKEEIWAERQANEAADNA
ncbi:hypothetical protein [Methanosphaerula subterraneus]|uniref:hypothetical protein n=1 Tax=Methanosphaerula subterraneus TaxID=3350244 RepID=UPI003F8609F1